MSQVTKIAAGTKVFLVRYALGGDVSIETVKETIYASEGYLHVAGRSFSFYKLGRDVAATRKQAVSLVRQMRDKKIKSLRKQIEKLEAMDPEAMVPSLEPSSAGN